jgi:hypothetical protein
MKAEGGLRQVEQSETVKTARTPMKLRAESSRIQIVRKTALGFLLCAFCFLPLVFAQTPPATGTAPAKNTLPSRIDPKAQDLLDKAIQALGGQAFLSFKTMSSRGRVFVIYEGSTGGYAPFVNDEEFPDKRRFAYGKEPPVILINNGDKGWELDRYGLIRQDSKRLRRWQMANRYSLEGVLRRVIHEPGVLVSDEGTDFKDLLPVHVLDIFDARHIEVKLYLQRSTFLPVRISYRLQNPADREWTVFAEAYSDYREIQGIQTPMHLTRYEDDERSAEYFLNSAEYNKEYPPGFFQPGR